MLSQLKNLGLSDKEARVYLASLELGPSTIQIIAKKAKVKRATAYSNIESLIKRGLASSFIQGKRNYFTAESPERLLSLLRVEEKEISEKKREFKTVLHDLKALEKLTQKDTPVVRFFEGKDGLQAIRDDFLKTSDKQIESIYPLEGYTRVFSQKETKEYRAKRKKKNIFVKALYTSSEGQKLPSKTKESIRRRVSFKKYPFSADIAFYDNKISMVSFKGQPCGVIIENKEITDTLRNIFELAWNGAKKNKGD